LHVQHQLSPVSINRTPYFITEAQIMQIWDRSAFVTLLHITSNCTDWSDCTSESRDPLQVVPAGYDNRKVLDLLDRSESDGALADMILGIGRDSFAESRTHPFWQWQPDVIHVPGVFICCCFLFLSGVLCAAGGIGGGGIYVTVLMVAGRLSVHDAVPLSKSIVFFGSLSSLALNLKKSFVGETRTHTLIDYGIVRVIVPSALIGTYLGVLLNRRLPSSIVIALLFCILTAMTVMTVCMTHSQFKEEGISRAAEQKVNEPIDANKTLPASDIQNNEPFGAGNRPMDPAAAQFRNSMGKTDVVLLVSMLLLVIVCGVFRYHSGKCEKDLRASANTHELAESCHHPSMFYLGNLLQEWMRRPYMAEYLRSLSAIAPICGCIFTAFYYTQLSTRSGWTYTQIFQYEAMAIVTGCLAGLVGIGGGLIFSPFMLLMGVEPSVAVATSSTCVIFTSSSTTLQYLFTDRVVISLTVIYGMVNLAASFAGTKLVHFLQDNFSARKSFISGIVALGLLISVVLTGLQFNPAHAAAH